jgi:hypothetical protein
MDADQERRMADRKAFKEMVERREAEIKAERKACEEKMMAEWKADLEKMAEQQVDQEKRGSERKATKKWRHAWKPFTTIKCQPDETGIQNRKSREDEVKSRKKERHSGEAGESQ